MDTSKTLDELEGRASDEPTFTSSVVTRCQRLRRKPLNALSAEDLRLLIGQQIGLDYLIPIAIDALEKDPLAEGDYYPGDLLNSVLTVEHLFWKRRPDLRERLEHVLTEARKVRGNGFY